MWRIKMMTDYNFPWHCFVSTKSLLFQLKSISYLVDVQQKIKRQLTNEITFQCDRIFSISSIKWNCDATCIHQHICSLWQYKFVVLPHSSDKFHWYSAIPSVWEFTEKKGGAFNHPEWASLQTSNSEIGKVYTILWYFTFCVISQKS